MGLETTASNMNFRYVAMIKQLDVYEAKRSILCLSRRDTFNGGDEHWMLCGKFDTRFTTERQNIFQESLKGYVERLGWIPLTDFPPKPELEKVRSHVIYSNKSDKRCVTLGLFGDAGASGAGGITYSRS